MKTTTAIRSPRSSSQATQSEEACQLVDVCDVHYVVDRVRGDVVTVGGGWHRQAEVGRQLVDVRDVARGIVVDVRRPGVDATVDERTCPGGDLDRRAEPVAVGVAGGYRPRRQVLGRVRPVRAVIGRISDAVSIAISRRGCAQGCDPWHSNLGIGGVYLNCQGPRRATASRGRAKNSHLEAVAGGAD